MNSRGTRSGASGRQLRKTVQGESSEITGGDDTIAPIGNDGVDTASCGNIRPEMETCDDERKLVFRRSSVSHLTIFFFSPVARLIDSFIRLKRRKIDARRIYRYIADI